MMFACRQRLGAVRFPWHFGHRNQHNVSYAHGTQGKRHNTPLHPNNKSMASKNLAHHAWEIDSSPIPQKRPVRRESKPCCLATMASLPPSPAGILLATGVLPTAHRIRGTFSPVNGKQLEHGGSAGC